MRTVLVMNAGSLQDHAFADPSAVTPGVIAAFNALTGANLVLDGSVNDNSVAMPKTFEFFQGHDDQPRRTGLIHRERIYDVNYKAYAAPAKQVTTISAIPVGTAGRIDSIKVINKTEGYYPEPTLNYEIKATAGQTAAQIAGALRDRINGNRRSFVVASVSGNNLVLTAKDFGTSFATVVPEGLEGAVVTGTTAPSLGSGSYAEVAKIEGEHVHVRDGDYHTNSGLLGAPAATERFASASETYDIYTIRHRNNMDKNINKGFEFHEITLCISTDVTGDLDAFFGDFL